MSPAREPAAPRRDWSPAVNLFDHLVVRHVRERHERCPALLFGDHCVSYGELVDRVLRTATVLRALGCKRGDCVVLLLPDTPSFVSVFFAALHLGAVAVPINPAATCEEVAQIVDRVRAAVVVVDAGCAAKFERLSGPRVRLIEAGDGCSRRDALELAIERASADVHPSSAVEDAIAYCLFSSGTTGAPKGIPHRHADILEGIIAYSLPVLAISADDRVLAVPKMTFGYGLGGNLLSALYARAASILVEEPSSVHSMRVASERHRPTLFLAQPRMVAELVRAESLAGLASLRLAVTAGEVLSPVLYTRWLEKGGCELLDGYGSTEVGHVFITNRVGDVRPSCAGQPIEGFDVRLTDEAGADVPSGAIGEIRVRGPSLARGYWNDPERTRECFVDGWVRTGDVGYSDATGHIYVCGRADDMIKTGCGEWVAPTEIEAALAEHPAIADCAVVGYSNPVGVVGLKAFAMLTAGTKPCPQLEDSLKAAVADRFGAFAHKRIEEVVFVSALPRSATGKLQRFRLKPATLTEFSYQC